MNLIFPTIMVFHFREIVQNYSRSLEIIIQIPIFYSCLIFKPVPVKCASGLHEAFFLFTNALFLVEVEVRSFTMIRPSGLYPSLQRKLTQTERVSFLLFAALISLHLFRAVRAASSSPSLLLLRPFSNAYSRTLPSVHRFPFSTLLSISSPFARAHRPYPIAIFLARPSIFLRTVSLAPLQGNRPNADAAGAHPAKIAPLSRRPIRPGTYVRTSATFAIGNFPPFRTN